MEAGEFCWGDRCRRPPPETAVGTAEHGEAWAKRRYPAHFLSKLTDADGELQETLHWIDSAVACCYVDETVHRELIEQAEILGRRLGKTISNYESFCSSAH
jgi:four helix bundle protein